MADDQKQQEGNPEPTQGQPAQATGTNPANTGSQAQASEQTFTQADIDRIVQERLERERQKHQKTVADKYGDYDELKTAAARLQEIEDANKSEAEKAAERLAKMEKQLAEFQSQNARLAEERQQALIQAQVVAKATTMQFNDPTDAYRMLDLSKIEIGEDGTIGGIDEQLEALSESKPYLLRNQQRATVSPTNPGKGRDVGETDAERRARLFGGGDTPIGAGKAPGGGVFMPS